SNRGFAVPAPGGLVGVVVGGAEGRAEGAPDAPLVTITDLPEAPPRVSPVVMRYSLQSAARKILGRDPLFKRLKVCHRQMVRDRSSVNVMYSPVCHSARFKNVVVCGSVWLCAVCGARIAEGRREELEKAIRRHHDDGGYVYFLTLTIPHSRS